MRKRRTKYVLKGLSSNNDILLTLEYSNFKNAKEEFNYIYNLLDDNYLLEEYLKDLSKQNTRICQIELYNLDDNEQIGIFDC